MFGDQEQGDLARFWRQLARWLVTEVPARATLTLDRDLAAGGSTGDGGDAVRLVATIRDQEYRPTDLARVQITVRRLGVDATAADATGPGFTSVTIPAEVSSDSAGRYTATFAGRDAGAYVAEVEALDPAGALIGKAQAGWVVDPAAEEFRSIEPNRALLAGIARRTGGELVPLAALEEFVAALPQRSAPVDEAWAWPVWNTAWVFLAVLACFATEWAWRRLRGLP
jgi:hypothetical protein